MKRFSKRGVHVGVIAALTAAALVAVILRPGMVTHTVDLHDDGVWATNGRTAMVTYLSYRSQTLSRGLRAPSTSFGVDQSGSQVVMFDALSDICTRVDDITPSRATGSGSTVPTPVSRRFCLQTC